MSHAGVTLIQVRTIVFDAKNLEKDVKHFMVKVGVTLKSRQSHGPTFRQLGPRAS